MIPHGPVWVLGIAGEACGVSAALVRTDGTRIAAMGPGLRRLWRPAEACMLATPGAAATELAETVAASVAATLSAGDGAPVPVLAGVEFRGPPAPDAAILAEVTGLPVAWDFRSADRTLGGAGRPLSPVFLRALARFRMCMGRTAFVDIGDVTTLCLVDVNAASADTDGTLLAFDAGPGPGLRLNGSGTVPGTVDEAMVRSVMAAPFFARLPPRHLTPKDLPGLADALAALSTGDADATLRALVARSVSQAVTLLPAPPARVVLTGPGRRDSRLRDAIGHGLQAPALTAEKAGFDGDHMAAQKIAFLALRVSRGMPTSFPGTTGVAAAVGGGQIARPQG